MQKRDKYDNVNIAGQRFGKLVAIEKVGKSKWLLHCDCGNDVILNYSRLLGGQLSCGCLRKEVAKKWVDAHVTHGKSKTKLYRKYRSMLTRCYDAKSKQYKRYGGRGITVCEEWRTSFENFSKWAYENGYDETIDGHFWSIDRKDNSKGYSPQNCRFATAKTQSNNRDVVTFYEYQGKQYTASEFADTYGIVKSFVYNRAKKGQTLEKILKDWTDSHNIPNGYVDIVQYASEHNVTLTTVNRWIHCGKVQAHKRGRKWYINPVLRKEDSDAQITRVCLR